VTALCDGIWKKPHDPAFIKTPASMTPGSAGQSRDDHRVHAIPRLDRLKVGDKFIMVDSGSGVGHWQPPPSVSNMKAAGIDPAKICTILICFIPTTSWPEEGH
jgi:hypothetical protein